MMREPFDLGYQRALQGRVPSTLPPEFGSDEGWRLQPPAPPVRE